MTNLLLICERLFGDVIYFVRLYALWPCQISIGFGKRIRFNHKFDAGYQIRNSKSSQIEIERILSEILPDLNYYVM